MKVLLLGATGMLGPYVVPELDTDYELLVTDIQEPEFSFRGEYRYVDIADADQVSEAARGMDAIINLSVLRRDRKLAFDVNATGCLHMMRAAVQHDIRRVINTGPHFTIAGPTYERFDYDLSADIPPQPGTNLYALSKSVGQEICRIFTTQYDIYVQTYLFYIFRDPANLKPEQPLRPFMVSWQNAAEVFPLGLDIELECLPSRCEIFNVFADMPHGTFRNDKVQRILGWQPRNDIAGIWTRDSFE